MQRNYQLFKYKFYEVNIFSCFIRPCGVVLRLAVDVSDAKVQSSRRARKIAIFTNFAYESVYYFKITSIMNFRFLVLLAAMMMAVVSVNAQSDTPLKGDVNGDGDVDVADVVHLVNYIIGKTNVNGDGDVDVADVVHLVNYIIGKTNSLDGDKTPAGVEAVDLGLPSGLKWANMNVGASSPENYGDYFAWGETTPQSDNTYKWESYKWCNGRYNTQTKYCNNSEYGNDGFTDNKTVLDAGDDAARANWGGDWRMPTKADFDELINNTTSEWTAQNGVYGRKFTSNKTGNSNSIFLPAAGYRWNGELYSVGSYSRYWSSTLDESLPFGAWSLYFRSGDVGTGYENYRCSGQPVRPVR